MTGIGILHVDLDAFYASVEQLADPGLAGRPVIVGGLGPRGVVAAASSEARHFGVHSAMPMARARRACPNGVFLAPRFDEYGRASRAVMSILRGFTPLVEPIALDEAFLDVRSARRLHGDALEAGTKIRERIRAETGLVASVGVASTKLLATVASDMAKPDGLLVVEAGTELEFLHPLDVGRLWGVGPATRRRLERCAVRTIGELRRCPRRHWSARSARPIVATCTRWPGTATNGRSSRYGTRSRSATRRRSPTTSRTVPSWSGRSSGLPNASRRAYAKLVVPAEQCS